MTWLRPLCVCSAIAACVACGGSSSSSNPNAMNVSAGGTPASGGASTPGGTNGSDGGSADTAGGAAGGDGSGGAKVEGGANGSGGAGVAGMSGASGVGTGSNGGMGGGHGGSGGAVGGVEEPESPCSTPGALACAGNYQRVTLVCTGGIWEVSDVCEENEACDTTPGLNQGSCKAILPECANQGLGSAFCSSLTTLQTCGPDNVTLVPEECTGSCHDDACDNRPNHCPAEDYVNCGIECGELDQTWCYVGEPACEGSVYSTAVSLLQAGETRIVRIGYDTACPASCDSQYHRVTVGFSLGAGLRAKVTALSPWGLSKASCEEGTSCFIVDAASGSFVNVITNEPSAPEQNIRIETAAEDQPLECP